MIKFGLSQSLLPIVTTLNTKLFLEKYSVPTCPTGETTEPEWMWEWGTWSWGGWGCVYYSDHHPESHWRMEGKTINDTKNKRSPWYKEYDVSYVSIIPLDGLDVERWKGPILLLKISVTVSFNQMICDVFCPSFFRTRTFFLWIEKTRVKHKTYECRCDERLKVKVEGGTRLVYTVLCGGLEHLNIETRLTDERL
jgi:hypothetical protein